MFTSRMSGKDVDVKYHIQWTFCHLTSILLVGRLLGKSQQLKL